MKKRKLIIASAVVASVIVGGSVFAMQSLEGKSNNQATDKSISPPIAKVQDKTTPEKLEKIPDVQTNTPALQEPAPAAQTPAVEITPVSKYPYATQQNERIWLVTDKAQLLSLAGIPGEDTANVSRCIRSWNFNEDGTVIIGDVAGGIPRMGALLRGADGKDPVNQIKWLNEYVKTRYGSWQRACENYDANGFF